MVVAFYFRLHLAYFPRPVVAIFARPEHHLYDYVENAGKVSALLSANNITIYQLAQSGDSLETYYTNLIGGCQND